MIDIFNQKFIVFQRLMLQTMKDVVVTMISPLTQQQIPPPSFQKTFSPPHQFPTVYYHSQKKPTNITTTKLIPKRIHPP